MQVCNNEKCINPAQFKIIHLGFKEKSYCLGCLRKYQNIMSAMGSPEALVYALDESED